jgi:hypothetical protein
MMLCVVKVQSQDCVSSPRSILQLVGVGSNLDNDGLDKWPSSSILLGFVQEARRLDKV